MGASRIMDYTTKWSLKLTRHLVEIIFRSLLNCRCFMRCVCIYRISAAKVSQLLSNGDIRVARTSKWWITQCSKVLVKMNKWNYNKNIIYSWIEFPMYPQYLAQTVFCCLASDAHQTMSNKCVVHTECIMFASFIR